MPPSVKRNHRDWPTMFMVVLLSVVVLELRVPAARARGSGRPGQLGGEPAQPHDALARPGLIHAADAFAQAQPSAQVAARRDADGLVLFGVKLQDLFDLGNRAGIRFVACEAI